MPHIKIDRGIDIPMQGKPSGEVKTLPAPALIALNLDPFDDVRFKLLVKVGDVVRIGEPLAEDKQSPGRFFVSPAAGSVHEIKRGLKRRLLDIVIRVGDVEVHKERDKVLSPSASRKEIVETLKEAGLFAHIRMRPFNLLANPDKSPRSIFVKALESAPFAPPAELQVQGHEKEFQTGLTLLSQLTDGPVYLVYKADSSCEAFRSAKNVQHVTAEGPHPVANPSVHIHCVDPIKKADDTVWTLNAHDVVCIGTWILFGRHHVHKVISIAGDGLLENSSGYFKVRVGSPISNLVSGRIGEGPVRIISGDPLTGKWVGSEDFLGFYDFSCSLIPENTERQFLHFFRLGTDKYTATRTYLSGQFSQLHSSYFFTTNQHGEERAFVDGSVYDKVMPLGIPTMHLIKAVLAEDYETAELLGILEVDSEDFALPAFICPSKIEMVELIKQAQKNYAKELLGED